jgi:hypothetical protein
MVTIHVKQSRVRMCILCYAAVLGVLDSFIVHFSVFIVASAVPAVAV